MIDITTAPMLALAMILIACAYTAYRGKTW